jgi:glycosyltransferase involved in cell wall biosynthesis
MSSLGERQREPLGIRHGARATERAACLISIIVCTRNRADKVGRTLRAIQSLEVPSGAAYEIIVVDNGSTDDTEGVCAAFQRSFDGQFRRVFLSTPGLSRAGNAGFDAASGDIIAYLDDDVLPREDWLSVVYRAFSRDAGLGAISGRVELFNPADLPTSIRRQTEETQFDSLKHAFGLFIGCNLAIRRALIDRVGRFDTDLGTGTWFGSAGDSDFFYRAWKAGEKLVFLPTLFVHHDHGRRTREAKLKLARDYVTGRGAFYAKHVLRGDSMVARACYWELISACRSLFDRRDDLGWRYLAWLLKGFVGYGFMALTRAALSPRQAQGSTPRP